MINQLVGDEGVSNVTPFTQLNGMGTMMAATQEASMADGPCTISGTNTNVRSGPSTSNDIVGNLSAGTQSDVIGQTTDANGFTWYQIDMGWVRGDVVQVAGNCSAVPMVSM
jgi:uncharacterized protein YgiM (DUF1202 family)